MLHHAKEYLEQLNYLIEGLEEHENSSVLSSLYQFSTALGSLPKEEHLVQESLNLLDSASIQIQEASNNLRQFMRQIQLDPERLIEVEERMSKWHQMARKLQVDIDELPEQLAILSEKIAAIEGHDKRLMQLNEEVKMRHTAYLQAAQELHAHRKKHAPELAHAIEQIIHELGMPHAKLSIDVQALDDMHPHGMDKVEYLISTNPGLAQAPLAKIASGGELSRISLSIHLITAQRGATPTLLFDEVDVGIGGATAMKVGKRLRELGERLQIFCVTHQPQVASCAHAQFKVSKTSANNQTFSDIVLLSQEERVTEIARMLGGLSITDQTRNNAKELLELVE
jgi:DNA repair protein RecN (Recombination protein N)